MKISSTGCMLFAVQLLLLIGIVASYDSYRMHGARGGAGGEYYRNNKSKKKKGKNKGKSCPYGGGKGKGDDSDDGECICIRKPENSEIYLVGDFNIFLNTDQYPSGDKCMGTDLDADNVNLAKELIDWVNDDGGLAGDCTDLDEAGRILIDSSRAGFLSQSGSNFATPFVTQSYAQGIGAVLDDPTIVDYLPSCGSIGPTPTLATCQRVDTYLSRNRYKSLVILAPSRVCNGDTDSTSSLLETPPYDCDEVAAILEFLESGGRLFIITDNTQTLDAGGLDTNDYTNALLSQLGATITVDNTSSNRGNGGTTGDVLNGSSARTDGSGSDDLCAANGSQLTVSAATDDRVLARWGGGPTEPPVIVAGNTMPAVCMNYVC